jgi:hypothetical protein
MKTRLFLAVVIATTIAGCATPHVTPQCSSRSPEEFESFMSRYMNDRQFATERTVAPLEMLDGPDREKSLATREQIAQSTLLSDVIKAENLSTSQSVAPGVVELKVFRPDADSHIYYYRFRLQNGCWHLWQFEDASL